MELKLNNKKKKETWKPHSNVEQHGPLLWFSGSYKLENWKIWHEEHKNMEKYQIWQHTSLVSGAKWVHGNVVWIWRNTHILNTTTGMKERFITAESREIVYSKYVAITMNLTMKTDGDCSVSKYHTDMLTEKQNVIWWQGCAPNPNILII